LKKIEVKTGERFRPIGSLICNMFLYIQGVKNAVYILQKWRKI